MKSNTEMHDNTAQNQDIIVTQKVEKPDRKASWERVKKLFKSVNLSDEDVDKAKEDRLG